VSHARRPGDGSQPAAGPDDGLAGRRPTPGARHGCAGRPPVPPPGTPRRARR